MEDSSSFRRIPTTATAATVNRLNAYFLGAHSGPLLFVSAATLFWRNPTWCGASPVDRLVGWLECAKQEVSLIASKDGFTAIQTATNDPRLHGVPENKCDPRPLRRPGKQITLHAQRCIFCLIFSHHVRSCGRCSRTALYASATCCIIPSRASKRASVARR
jgi:hypothetical protein